MDSLYPFGVSRWERSSPILMIEDCACDIIDDELFRDITFGHELFIHRIVPIVSH